MRSLKRKNKRKVSVISKSNINKNIIKNVIRLHLSRRSDTGQFKPAELGAGQYHAGAGSNPFVSFPSLSYSAGSADAFPGLLSGEQTANQVAVAQMRSADKRNDITTGGAPASNSYMNTYSSPAPAGNVQGRSIFATPVKKTPSQVSSNARKELESNRKMNEQLQSLFNQATLQSKQAASPPKQTPPQSKQTSPLQSKQIKPKKPKPNNLSGPAANVGDRDPGGKGRPSNPPNRFTPSKN